MKVFRFFPLLALAGLFLLTTGAATRPIQQQQREETLAVRRLMTLWKEGEKVEAKPLLDDFLTRYPRSNQRDKVATMRAEIAFDEKDYKTAAALYQKVDSQRFRATFKPHFLYTLFHEKAWTQLFEEVAPLIPEDTTKLTSRTELLNLYYSLEAQRHLAKQQTSKAARIARLRDVEKGFERLNDTPFQEHALTSLAALNEDAGDFPRAAQLWRMLAWQYPETRKDALFQAAVLESHYDKESAIDAFADLYATFGAEAANALFNQVTLLYSQGRYEEVLALEDEILQCLPTQKAPEAHLYLGQIHLENHQYAQALEALERYLDGFTDQAAPDKEALFAGAQAAYLHENLEALHKFSQALQNQAITTDQHGQLLMMQALLCNRQNQPAAAYQTLQIIEATFPSLARTDTLAFEKALALYQLRQWEAARTKFTQFAECFPKSTLEDEAWAYIIDTTTRVFEGMKDDHPNLEAVAEEAAITAAESLRIVIDDEKRLGNALVNMGRALLHRRFPQQAMEVLEAVTENFEDHPQMAQAHYLLAIAELNECDNPHRFALHAEKTLTLAPHFPAAAKLHKELYSLYAAMAREEEPAPGFDQATCLNQAADHLYHLTLLKGHKVPQPVKLWAADHYYRQAMNFTPEGYSDDQRPTPLTEADAEKMARRGIALYENAFNITVTSRVTPSVSIAAENITQERDLFRLARLLQMLDQEQEAMAVLDNLRDQILKRPDLNWQMASQVLLELSLACEKCGRCEDALCILNELAHEVRDASPYMVNYARLQTARLSFLSVPEEQRREKNPRIQDSLKTLLELQTRRHMSSEPLHLEAAMDYALFRATLEKTDSRDELLLDLLTRAKRDFASTDTLFGRDYHEGRKASSEQDFVYQTYQMLFDARIAQVKARIAHQKGNRTEARSQEKAAQDLFRMLTKEAFAVSRYLLEEAEQGLKELAEGNHSTEKANTRRTREASPGTSA